LQHPPIKAGQLGAAAVQRHRQMQRITGPQGESRILKQLGCLTKAVASKRAQFNSALQQALELVAELRRTERITVISALHDLTLAGTYTDRLVMLHHGDVVAAGDAAEVLTADRLGKIYNVCVTVEVDVDELGNRQVVVVPRRGFPAP